MRKKEECPMAEECARNLTSPLENSQTGRPRHFPRVVGGDVVTIRSSALQMKKRKNVGMKIS